MAGYTDVDGEGSDRGAFEGNRTLRAPATPRLRLLVRLRRRLGESAAFMPEIGGFDLLLPSVLDGELAASGLGGGGGGTDSELVEAVAAGFTFVVRSREATGPVRDLLSFRVRRQIVLLGFTVDSLWLTSSSPPLRMTLASTRRFALEDLLGVATGAAEGDSWSEPG